MLLVLIGFAGSVLGTRAFLALTGYPQVGGGTLHISHALWGGLLLFLAALIPLLVVNRFGLVWAAPLAGLGVGLFIDEVGKFITADSDYFFPAAAPIAYAVFLLAVWLYVRVRDTRARSAPEQLHAALELLADAVDHGLSDRDQGQLRQRLRDAAASPDCGHLQPMAAALLESTRPEVLPAREPRQERTYRLAVAVQAWVNRTLTRGRLRVGLVVALGVLGLAALSDLTAIVAVAVDLRDGATGELLRTANEFTRIEIEDRRGVLLLLVRALLDTLLGVALLVATGLLLRGVARRAAELAQAGLLASLSVVSPLVFYLDQFAAAVSALAQLAVLLSVRRYQRLCAQRTEQPPNR
ncbi:hypothetical protein GA0074695_4118 [Micromonospora viridifaciens]|uniref:Uncharacterized protein n=1 Tax=Micromonospora viridifaciens TaxID=1881 RepID=A0A1C4YD11_MICVI|nr:hypothetical protein [Micromonospora viridifaciens]SCF18526.1 hypothetical protein GA0074695_4118 [Micromonospora viridifaciens]